jgi:PAS domain S-box-containing protein
MRSRFPLKVPLEMTEPSLPDELLADDRDPASAAAMVLTELAEVFLSSRSVPKTSTSAERDRLLATTDNPNVDARYRALVEQIPAIVFMAYLDEGMGEAYVSPQIEAALGFSQQEWLEDPVRWYQRIHPDDKERWSVEAADMFLSGGPLRSAYRVIARDGCVRWFHCQAAMIRRSDGRPWFIHGVAIDITELKRAEQALQEERNLAATILDTVGALVVVLDPEGRIIRFNRACERASARDFSTVEGHHVSDLFETPEEAERFRAVIEQWRAGAGPAEHDGCWVNDRGERRIITWSGTLLRGADGSVEHIITTGTDVTERKRLERALLDLSGREQRRIGQDLHDGLGQHLTGTAFMSKVLQQKLEDQALPEAAEAKKIVTLVNQAIEKTRELSRGLLPVLSDADGLMSALKRFAGEVEDLFSVSCSYICPRPVLLGDVVVATHLFFIAQEAVNNAIKHGRARHITIGMSVLDDKGCLAVQDDGVGLRRVPESHPGMGLHIMQYRANMIGGTLAVTSGRAGGTVVDCLFPLRSGD